MRFAIVALITMAYAGLPGLRAQENVYDEIDAAWEKRNKAVRTAEFEIKCSQYYTKGSISAQFAGVKSENETLLYTSPMPAEDTTIQFLATYSLQDNRVRLTLDGTMWTGSKFAKCREVIIYTPNGARHLREIDGELKVGHVEKSSDYFMANTEAFLPLTHCFRSGSDYPSRTLVAHKLKEVGKQVRIGDQECTAFAKASESANTQLYYLISSKEWIVARQTIKEIWPGSRIVYDINYRSDTSGLDIPSGWEVKTVFANPTIGMTHKYQVTNSAINRTISASSFNLDFPAGTKVFDESFGNNLPVVVQPDGSYQPAADATPQQLAQFRKLQEKSRTERLNNIMLYIGIALLLSGSIALIVRAFWKARMSRKHASTQTPH